MNTENERAFARRAELTAEIALLEEEKCKILANLSVSLGTYILANKLLQKVQWDAMFLGDPDTYEITGKIKKNSVAYKQASNNRFVPPDLPGYSVSVWIYSNGGIKISGTINELGRLIKEQGLLVDTGKLTDAINRSDSWSHSQRINRGILLGKQE